MFTPAAKKLQIFVSSTYTDLKQERQAAVEAILTAGHIPAGMELFTAGDQSQMEVIKRWIDESDVYLLILGSRYGTIDKITDKSYTHLEYEYALERKMPVFAVVINEIIIEQRVRDKGFDFDERSNPEKLKEFRHSVTSRMVEFWSDLKDIKLTVINKLAELSRRSDLVGWVRASTQSNLPALTDEMARLSKENADLRAIVGQKQDILINGIPYQNFKSLLQKDVVLDYLIKNRQRLDGKCGLLKKSDDHVFMKKLSFRDIVELNDTMSSNNHFYPKITPSGMAFLNAYDIETNG